MTGDLFEGLTVGEPRRRVLGDGAVLLTGFLDRGEQATLVTAVDEIAEAAPFRHLVTPGGYRMSVAMTNSGSLGWVSDSRGYRYDPVDPESRRRWPPMPAPFLDVAARAAVAAGYAPLVPDACLINRYAPGARLSLHQDRNECDLGAPIISISLGLPAVFLFGGTRRATRPTRHPVASGDVAVWGGALRLAFHGVAPLGKGQHPVTGECRLNLTFRKTR